MAFAWLKVPLETTFGTVAGLHWDYYDGKDEGGRAAATKQDAEAAVSSDAEPAPGVERGPGAVLADTDDLEAAEDELGAVMWNANGVSCDAMALRLGSAGGSGNGGSAQPPLGGWDILELGSGVGVMGVALALGGADVMITDLPRLEGLMRRTIKENRRAVAAKDGAGSVVAAGFNWTAKTLPTDVAAFVRGRQSAKRLCICMCDALYGNPKTWGPLIRHLGAIHSVAVAAGRADPPLFLNFCEQRVKNHEDGFFEQLRAADDGRWAVSTTTLSRKSELGLDVRMTEFSVSTAAAGGGAPSSPCVAAAATTDRRSVVRPRDEAGAEGSAGQTQKPRRQPKPSSK